MTKKKEELYHLGKVYYLECPEANIVKRFVIDTVSLVGVLDELVHRQCGIVGLDDGVGDLRRRHHRVGVHDSVGILLADFGDEEGTHTGTGTTTQRVGQLEALEAVAVLALLAHDVEDRVDELGALGVVALGPVISGARLAENEVVRPEELAVGAGTHRVHRARLEVQQNCTGHIFAAARG